ncbi:MAG: DUF1638 domain-containing protein [Mogibacterium sp.]|nr:DUF1638 domain-containing protein [Mogibacterium sp.]
MTENNTYYRSARKVLIACSMIEDEINAVFDRFGIQDIEIRWQERGHHNDPDKLREVIQAEIERAEEDGADLIMLAYGLCGNGAVGWHTKRAVLVMPRFDDCVNMMLCTGKRDRRNYLDAGNMYLTGGWSRDEGALLTMLDSYLEKYGERKGKKLMKHMLASYSAVTVIDTGCFEMAPVIDYADECAGKFGLERRIVPGGNEPIQKLLTGNWDDDIIVMTHGQPVSEENFEFIKEQA